METAVKTINDAAAPTEISIGPSIIVEDTASSTTRREENKASFFAQMEKYLLNQKVKCDYYSELFRNQNNDSLAQKFDTYGEATDKDLDLLRVAMRNNDPIPDFKFELVNFNCVPINTDVKEKELQITVRADSLRTNNNALIYAIGEFSFPTPQEEPMGECFARWVHSVKIDPKAILCCSSSDSRQLDIVYSTDAVPFTNPDSQMLEFDRPLSFYIDKGKSRSLKRKFKPVKITFYEKTSFIHRDNKLGHVQIKIDDVNDEIVANARLNIMNGRRQLDASAELKVRVREPLANKTIRAHEEKLLLLTF